MGWLFSHNNKGELIRDLLKSNERFLIEKHCIRGNCLWSVIHDRESDERFINLDLIEKYEGRWGHKRMDESCGPYHFSCPLGYIKIVEEYPPKGYAKEWRDKVREHHKYR